MLARKIEALRVSWLVWSSAGVTLLSAVLLFWLSKVGEGIAATFANSDGSPAQAPAFLDCLYFSVVSISSLGYGDFRPVGYGRMVAGAEVILGLILIALIVSKLASDRTSAYVRLLYTSDSERRLKEFKSDIHARVSELRLAQHDHDHESKLAEINSLGLIAVNLAKYYQYQVKVGGLGEDWARKNSLRVVRAIARATEELSRAGKAELAIATEHHSIRTAFRHIQRAIREITNSHCSDDFKSAREHIQTTIESYERCLAAGRTKPVDSEVTPHVLQQVSKVLPSKPWPRHVHKLVAQQLRISNRLAHRAITVLEGDENACGAG